MEERPQLLRRVRIILWSVVAGGGLILGISLAVALTRQAAPEPVNPALLVTSTASARPTIPPTQAPPAKVTSSPSGPPAIVRFGQAQGEIAVGQTNTVAVEVAEVIGLFGAQVHVNCDPMLLEVQDADLAREGVQIQEGTFPDPRGGRGFVAAN
ncbi:MAG: hypothetical protein HYX89_03660 [Chloroflexi bacterium]|nr:hypothetical protein [Chloroflexota bacterium]